MTEIEFLRLMNENFPKFGLKLMELSVFYEDNWTMVASTLGDMTYKELEHIFDVYMGTVEEEYNNRLYGRYRFKIFQYFCRRRDMHDEWVEHINLALL